MQGKKEKTQTAVLDNSDKMYTYVKYVTLCSQNNMW